MNIKGSSIYDSDTVRDMIRFSVFKKRNPERMLIAYTVLIVSCLIIINLLSVFIRYNDNAALLNIVGVIGLTTMYYMYFILPKVRYKSLKEMKDTVNEFEFLDDKITVRSNNPKYAGEAALDYGLLFKVYETDKYFYLFQDKLQLYIVNKSTLSDNPGGITDKFINGIGKKYIRCNY